MTPEHKQKISLALTGIKRSVETRKKISESGMGRTAWNKGKPGSIIFSESTKENLRKHTKSSWEDPDIRRKRTDGIKKAHARKTPEQRKIPKNCGENNPAKRPEVRMKISETLKNQYEKGNIVSVMKRYQNPNNYSDIERLVGECLAFLGIKYCHNVRIGRYTVDFLIFGIVIIECDGWWHENSCRKANDLIRDKYLEEKGYQVFHLGWREIKENVISCVERCLISRT